MEENDNQVIIDFTAKNLDALIVSLQELQKQYEANKAKLDALDKSSEDYDKQVIQLTQQQKSLKTEMRGVENQIQNEIKVQKAQEDSLVQLRAQLANLNKQYDSMSGFERMGTAGEELRKKIKTLSDNISSLEANTGRYQRNVGNYKSALEGLSGGFKAAGLSTRGLDQSLKLLNGNPIMLFFTAVVTIVKSVINAFKSNESATMALKEAFAAFNPIIDAAKRGLETMAKVITSVVTVAVNGLTSAIGWLLDKVQDIGNFFGADWHMGDNFRNAQQAAEDLQKSENDYIKAKREWSVESAKIDRDVADLREKAAQKDQYNAKQRLEYLDQAIALETKKAAEEKKFAEWNLENLKKEAERTANSAEMNEKLAEAERAVIEADTRLSDTKRQLSKQRQAALNETNNLTTSTKNYAAAVKELRQELELIKMLSIDEALQEQAKQSKQLAEALQEVVNRVGLLDEQFEKLDPNRFADFTAVTDEGLKDTTTKLDLFAEAYKNNANDIEQTSKALESSFGSLSDIYKQMAEDESKTEQEREEAARKAKMWSAMQIAANSGVAIAKGVAEAVEAGPFPANLAALATTMAAVLSALAQARALAESHEHGGVIGEKFIGATRGSDDVLMFGRRGEMVLNADQQRTLFDIANGSPRTNMTAELAAMISSMPAPVLDYKEFTNFTKRVASMDETAKLR